MVGWVYSGVLTHRFVHAEESVGEYTHPTWMLYCQSVASDYFARCLRLRRRMAMLPKASRERLVGSGVADSVARAWSPTLLELMEVKA